MKIQYKHQLNKIATILLAASVISTPFVCSAEDEEGTVVTDATASGTDQTATYLNNLGLYIGFQLDAAPANPPSTTTPDLEQTINSQFYAGVSYIASLPFVIDISKNPGITYVPNIEPVNTTDQYNLLTSIPVAAYSVWANMGTGGTIESTNASAVVGINQLHGEDDDNASYYSNMTSQYIFDLLTTPDYTYCTSDKSAGADIYTMEECEQYGLKDMPITPFHNLEVSNAILSGGQTVDGNFVTYGNHFFTSDDALSDQPTIFFSTAVNEPLVPQLNADALMGPLMYNTQVISNTNDDETGYPGDTQETQAMAFIRYVSGMNLSSVLPSYNDYTTAYKNLQDTDVAKRNSALKGFINYFLGIRTLAANLSVGTSNLAGIMGSRMVNKVTNTSQAYDEYVMATRRVLNPDSSDTSGKATNKWVTDMENASPITMQRELLYLMADNLYMTYQNKVLNEKILLTLSAMELQYANSGRGSLTIVGEEPE